jgi:hypothetical protein
MDAGDLSSDESQPLLEENGHPLLRRRSTMTQIGLQYSEHTFHAATMALRESNTGWLLIFMPLGIVFSLFEWNSVATLLFNIAAIIPLSALVSDSADQLRDHLVCHARNLFNCDRLYTRSPNREKRKNRKSAGSLR